MVQNVIEWVHNNYKWVFSGIGVALIGTLIAVFFPKNKGSQSQKSGKNSLNIQAGNNIQIDKINESENSESKSKGRK